MGVFLPPAKGFSDLSSGHGRLVFPLQPGSLPGSEGAEGWVIQKCPMVTGQHVNQRIWLICYNKKFIGLAGKFRWLCSITIGSSWEPCMPNAMLKFISSVNCVYFWYFTALPWYLILVLLLAPLCSDDRVRPSYLNSLKMLICHMPYQRLVLGFVFSALAFQV